MSVERRVHQFVVAQKSDELTPCSCRLRLPFIDGVEDGAVVVSAVDLVAGLDDDQSPADPSVVGVSRAREAQHATRAVEVAMQIADGNEPRGGRSRESIRKVDGRSFGRQRARMR